ncbi:MAG TPA: tRNA pseudouridine(55) synthase TruB [Gemmatimonadaceae bacterium]|nr:tRNA pseudouridine(55) synthase TruB [Gemmatimonadaceae bacterium]
MRRTSLSADGLLLVDKTAGMTSHDVVARARRALGERRIGHMGTLDPFATGLLVLLVGRATRLAQHLDGEPKEYEAELRFGSETTTDDLSGAPTREAPLAEPERVVAAIASLTGTIEQLPPAYSAKKVGGERAYRAAREGRSVELRPVPVHVESWEVLELGPERARVRIRCGGGTYVRALARDLGRLAGSAAHLTALRRTASGPFRVERAIPADALVPQSRPPLLSPLEGLVTHARRALTTDEVARVVRGMRVPADGAGARAALVDDAGEIVALGERVGDSWQPRVVLRDA